jgi:hypothetical protein
MEKKETNQTNEMKQIIEFFMKLIEKYPNDQELGSEIRNYYWENLKK